MEQNKVDTTGSDLFWRFSIKAQVLLLATETKKYLAMKL